VTTIIKVLKIFEAGSSILPLAKTLDDITIAIESSARKDEGE